MAVESWQWGIALVVAGASLIGGFVGNILAGMAVEIEIIEKKYPEDTKLLLHLKKMFFKYFFPFLILTCFLIIFGFYLINS